MAADMGRDVLAVPGSPLDPRAQGCNQLIREGATLVQSPADVLEAMSGFAEAGTVALGQRFQLAEPPGLPPPAPAGDVPAEARPLLERLLSPAPVTVDELVRQSGLAAGAVAHVLLDLELEGAIERHAGGRVSAAR
jgi:DNA processing protein